MNCRSPFPEGEYQIGLRGNLRAPRELISNAAIRSGSFFVNRAPGSDNRCEAISSRSSFAGNVDAQR